MPNGTPIAGLRDHLIQSGIARRAQTPPSMPDSALQAEDQINTIAAGYEDPVVQQGIQGARHLTPEGIQRSIQRHRFLIEQPDVDVGATQQSMQTIEGLQAVEPFAAQLAAASPRQPTLGADEAEQKTPFAGGPVADDLITPIEEVTDQPITFDSLSAPPIAEVNSNLDLYLTPELSDIEQMQVTEQMRATQRTDAAAALGIVDLRAKDMSNEEVYDAYLREARKREPDFWQKMMPKYSPHLRRTWSTVLGGLEIESELDGLRGSATRIQSGEATPADYFRLAEMQVFDERASIAHGLPKFENFAEMVEWSKDNPDNMDWVIDRMPFLGGFASAARDFSYGESLKRVNTGVGTEFDEWNVARFLGTALRAGESSFSDKAIDAISSFPAFMTEFITTGGMANIVRKGGQSAIRRAIAHKIHSGLRKSIFRKAVSGSLRRNIVGFARKTGPSPIGVTIQTLFNPQLTARSMARHLVDGYMTETDDLKFDREGHLVAILGEDNDDFQSALIKGYADSAIEIFSERTGFGLGRMLGGTRSAKFLGGLWNKMPLGSKTRALKAALIARGSGHGLEPVSRLIKRAGWDGYLNEIMEERVGDVMRWSVGLQDSPLPSLEQLAVEGVAFAVFPGAQLAYGMVNTPRSSQAIREALQEKTEELRAVITESGKIENLSENELNQALLQVSGGQMPANVVPNVTSEEVTDPSTGWHHAKDSGVPSQEEADVLRNVMAGRERTLADRFEFATYELNSGGYGVTMRLRSAEQVDLEQGVSDGLREPISEQRLEEVGQEIDAEEQAPRGADGQVDGQEGQRRGDTRDEGRVPGAGPHGLRPHEGEPGAVELSEDAELLQRFTDAIGRDPTVEEAANFLRSDEDQARLALEELGERGPSVTPGAAGLPGQAEAAQVAREILERERLAQEARSLREEGEGEREGAEPVRRVPSVVEEVEEEAPIEEAPPVAEAIEEPPPEAIPEEAAPPPVEQEVERARQVRTDVVGKRVATELKGKYEPFADRAGGRITLAGNRSLMFGGAEALPSDSDNKKAFLESLPGALQRFADRREADGVPAWKERILPQGFIEYQGQRFTVPKTLEEAANLTPTEINFWGTLFEASGLVQVDEKTGDVELFLKAGAEAGIRLHEYIHAAARLGIISEQQINRAAKFLNRKLNRPATDLEEDLAYGIQHLKEQPPTFIARIIKKLRAYIRRIVGAVRGANDMEMGADFVDQILSGQAFERGLIEERPPAAREIEPAPQLSLEENFDPKTWANREAELGVQRRDLSRYVSENTHLKGTQGIGFTEAMADTKLVAQMAKISQNAARKQQARINGEAIEEEPPYPIGEGSEARLGLEVVEIPAEPGNPFSRAHQVPAQINPSPLQLIAGVRASAGNYLRGFTDGEDLVFWDGMDAIHDEMRRGLRIADLKPGEHLEVGILPNGKIVVYSPYKANLPDHRRLSRVGHVDLNTMDPLSDADQKLIDRGTFVEGAAPADRVIVRKLGLEENQRIRELYEQALAEIKSGQPAEIGRPDLANPSDTEDARARLRAIDEHRKTLAGEEFRPEDLVAAEVKARMESSGFDRDSEAKRLAELAATNRPMSDVDVVIAQKIWNQVAEEALENGDTASFEQAIHVGESYRKVMGTIARALRMGKSMYETKEDRIRGFIQTQLTAVPTRKQKQLDDLDRKIDAARGDTARLKALLAKRKKIIKNMANEIRKLRDKIEKLLGKPLSEITDEELNDMRVVNKVIRRIQETKSTPFDMLFEFWINSILSGPRTQAANIMGNFGLATWDNSVQRLTEIFVNAVLPGKKMGAARLGEVGFMLKGALPNLRRGAENAWSSFWDQRDVFAEEISGSKIEAVNRRVAIPGMAGTVIRTPTRMLTAMDNFFKTQIAQTHATVLAYRSAKDMGLSGNALSTHMQTLLADTDSSLWDEAHEEARRLTFQNDPGKFADMILGIRKKWPLSQFILPFVTTPVNIFKTGLRKSPLGTLRFMYKGAKGEYRGDRQATVRDLSEQLLSWSMFYILLGWTMPDEETGLPRITGSRPTDYGEAQLHQRVVPPTSIRLFGTWVDYNRIEPFAVTLATTVDAINAFRIAKDQGDAVKAMSSGWATLINQTEDKTFLRGMSDLIRAVNDPSRYLPSWAANFGSSWVPNIVRSIGRDSDEDIRDQRFYGDLNEAFLVRSATIAGYKALPGILPPPPARFNYWGEPITRQGPGLGPKTDALYRLTIPIRLQEVDLSFTRELDRMILNYNNSNPTDLFLPRQPYPTFEHAKRRFIIEDPELYQQFLMESGQMAAKRLERIHRNRKFNIENPGDREIDLIKTITRASRTATKNRMIVRNLRALAGEGKVALRPGQEQLRTLTRIAK